MAQCGAKTRSGHACKRFGMPNGRCKFHGGMTPPPGPGHHNYKHGRYSKFLPKGLAASYQHALEDPNLVSVRDEIALMDLRASQLLEAIGTTGTVTIITGIRARLREFKNSGTKGKAAVGAARVALQQLEEEIDRALTAATTWDELRDTIDLRRRLSEAETKRLRDLQQLITVEKALALMMLLVDEVNKRVTDPEAVAAVRAVFLRLAGTGDRGRVEGGAAARRLPA